MSIHPLLPYLQTIPAGYVVSYAVLGRVFGIHPRTVASILRANTLQDVYPCYRVIHADRTLGGYNLWPEEKIRRLKTDGVIIIEGKVSMECMWTAKIRQTP